MVLKKPTSGVLEQEIYKVTLRNSKLKNMENKKEKKSVIKKEDLICHILFAAVLNVFIDFQKLC